MRRPLSREQAESIAPGHDVDVSRSGSTVALHLHARDEAFKAPTGPVIQIASGS